jgi:hypothetical protein
MSTHTIDTATVKRLVEARAIRGAAIGELIYFMSRRIK